MEIDDIFCIVDKFLSALILVFFLREREKEREEVFTSR